MSPLNETAIYLSAAVIAVPLFKKLRFGAVLGYLAAGIVIGPHVLGLVSNVESILNFSELGVVLLLFVIGLELQPSRLWVLRKTVFGLGGAQVAVTAALLGAVVYSLGLTPGSALIAGLGLSLSSTAFVLQILAEKNQLTTRHGRTSFAILLFQDLAVIPMLALIPLLAAKGITSSEVSPGLGALKSLAVVAAVIIGGRLLLRPVFRAIAASRIQEVFTAAALLVVIGTSLLMQLAGLSMSLGAFLAGVLLADSEYRHELEADIEPFKGLLLGLFFIAVGMSANLVLVASRPVAILAAVIALMAIKYIVVFLIGKISGCSIGSARNLAVALSQGGEFAFVLFSVAAALQIMDQSVADTLIVVVTISMALTPAFFSLNEAIEKHWLARGKPADFDKIDEGENRVIIAGFGRVGQIVGRILRLRKIRFTALELSQEQLDVLRRFGNKVYYGDASRLDLLRAAKADKAEIFILAIDDVASSLKTAATVKRHFPNLAIYARARNRFHAYQLMDIGVDGLIRETLLSSLDLARQVLLSLGIDEEKAHGTIDMFKKHDEKTLLAQHAVYHDETKLIQSTKEAARELQGIFESDTLFENNTGKPASPVPLR
ncbi:MAG TPA: monovalent cation:proton antiporter-2 (CPA2) family protein [Burkholderiales bacterium]|nr:monovalent cation:proton antiporter-2 (CPA2) family protein [Burkholderiales bacterium]